MAPNINYNIQNADALTFEWTFFGHSKWLFGGFSLGGGGPKWHFSNFKMHFGISGLCSSSEGSQLQCASNLYCSTPFNCTAARPSFVWGCVFLDSKPWSIWAPAIHLTCCSTPPLCMAVRFLFARPNFCASSGGWGFWKHPGLSSMSHACNRPLITNRTCPCRDWCAMQ